MITIRDDSRFNRFALWSRVGLLKNPYIIEERLYRESAGALISVVFTAANKWLLKTCFTDIALSVRIYAKYANEISLFFLSIASIYLTLNYRFVMTLLWRWINKYKYYFTHARIDIKVI